MLLQDNAAWHSLKLTKKYYPENLRVQFNESYTPVLNSIE